MAISFNRQLYESLAGRTETTPLQVLILGLGLSAPIILVLTLTGWRVENPLVLLLIVAAAISWFLDEHDDALLIVAIVAASSAIGFWQEWSAGNAVRTLMRMVAVRATVLRDGSTCEVPVEELVPGDVVQLAAGSIVPADARLLHSNLLFVDEASLTGESYPAEKLEEPSPVDAPISARRGALYAGTHVLSGTGTAVLVATGRVPVSKELNLASVGVETNRGFIPVNDQLQVLVGDQPVAHLWAVGDVTGKMMLAHTAAAQGAVAVDNILGHPRSIDYRSIPAATFTHPEISSVGLSEVDAKELAAKEGFELGVVRSYFKANSKALAELESDGLMKLLFNKATGEVLGAHIYGLHAADLIQEIANAVARRQSVKQLVNEVHTHPTLSEVVEVAYKQAAMAVGAAVKGAA